MTESNTRLIVSVVGNVIKASLILLVISSGLMIYALADSDVSGNYSKLSPQETMVTSPIYRETNEKLQLIIITGEDDESYDTENEVINLHVVIQQSLTRDFDESSIVYSANLNEMVRDVSVIEPSYYRMELTNLSERDIQFATGSAAGDLGSLMILTIGAILLGISIAMLSVTLSLSIIALVFLAMLYPVFLIIKNESQTRMYYPTKYHTAMTESNQTQNTTDNV